MQLAISKLDLSGPDTQDLFSDSYDEARAKFLDACNGNHREYVCSAKGPNGEALFTDAAYLGDPKAHRVLVLISGTHGAEGYCGSAAQLLFLRSGLGEHLPSSSAVLLIHALNAYGFAWDRRVTAEGCDLNRNFVDFTRPLPPNENYALLADHLVPKDLSAAGLQRAEEALAAFRQEHGEWKFQEARKSGQYTCPGGMFYGGTEPTEARQLLERIAADFNLANRQSVVIVDYHTGLGPYGYGELQCEQPSGLAGYERARAIFGESVTSPDLGTSASVVINGSQDDFWNRLLGERHTYVCLEFGTYSTDSARVVQRDDLWLFRHRPELVNEEQGKIIRRAARNHFYPSDTAWNEMVAWRSHQVHRQALASFR